MIAFKTIAFKTAVFSIAVAIAAIISCIIALWFPICLGFDIYWKISGTHVHPSEFSKDMYESFERSVIQTKAVCDEQIESSWDEIEIAGVKGKFSLHTLITRSKTRSAENPNLVWLHGVGGSAAISFAISGIMGRLVDHYNIYCLDLPGFGRSTAPHQFSMMEGPY